MLGELSRLSLLAARRQVLLRVDEQERSSSFACVQVACRVQRMYLSPSITPCVCAISLLAIEKAYMSEATYTLEVRTRRTFEGSKSDREKRF